MIFYKNQNGRYESPDGTELTCGCPVEVTEDGNYLKGRIEHDGKDYYIYVSQNIKVQLYDGIELTIPKE